MKKRREILGFIKGYQMEHGYSPSMREIARAVGIEQSGVWRHLHILEAEGRIRLTKGIARSIRIIVHKL